MYSVPASCNFVGCQPNAARTCDFSREARNLNFFQMKSLNKYLNYGNQLKIDKILGGPKKHIYSLNEPWRLWDFHTGKIFDVSTCRCRCFRAWAHEYVAHSGTMPAASDKAITELVLLGSITKPLGFLVCKMGTTVALPVPQRKRRICRERLAKPAHR